MNIVDNTFLNVILWIIIVLVAIIGVFYLVDQYLKFKPFLLKAKKFFLEHVYFLLLPFPIFYLIYYYEYYQFAKDTKQSFLLQPEAADYLKDISKIVFTGGIFTAAFKTLNNLIFFKKQFKEVVESPEFSNVLSHKLQVLALSDEYLLERSDLRDIWARVTICKYQQKFPELGKEIKHKMENDLFLEDSLNYYYKNFRLQINFSLEGDIIKIVEISSFALISHSESKIELNFGTNSLAQDNEIIYTKLIHENCKQDGKILVLEDDDNSNIPGYIPDLTVKKFKAQLEGQTRYIIERQIEITQNILEDRVFSFSSTRIIEDLSINLKHQSNLNLFFSPVGKNIFNEDNHLRSDFSTSYISRELLLPGEKFKVFIYKKG